MATRRDNYENDPGDEAWLMFVRNQGDEGFCSSQFWDAGFEEDYTFKLPWREGMIMADVDWNKTDLVGSEGTSGPTVAVLPPGQAIGLGRSAGVYVTFHLGPAVHHSLCLRAARPCPLLTARCTSSGRKRYSTVPSRRPR